MDQYDFVVLVEAPDDQTAAAQVLGVANRGASRPETLRAFTLDEVSRLSQTYATTQAQLESLMAEWTALAAQSQPAVS